MKVLLTQAGEPEGVAPVFPLGLAYLAGSLSGHEVRGFASPLHGDYDTDLEQTVADFSPDVVCISLRNLDNQRYATPVSYLPEARNVVRICRQSSGARIVVGGSGFSIAPEPLLDYLGADAGLAGEGESCIAALVRAVARETDYTSVPGNIAWQRADVAMVRPSLADDLDGIELPDRNVFEPKKYLREKLPLNVRAKRGCPFKCIYCTTPQIEGTRLRLRSPDRVVDELQMLKREYGADDFYFTDNIFNYPPHHAEAICEGIVARKLDIRWYCIANPGSLSQDLLQLMKRAGCYGLSLGNESGSPRMLRRLRKTFTAEQIELACTWCRDIGIACTCFLLLGGPGEDRKSVEESVALMEKMEPDHLSIAIGIRIYPHTELARISAEEGVVDSSTDLLSPAFYLPGQVRGWIFDYIREVGGRNGWTYPTPA